MHVWTSLYTAQLTSGELWSEETSVNRIFVYCAAQVWYPHPLKDINSLENVQKFALRVCCKNWNMGYSEFLDLCSVPSLENLLFPLSGADLGGVLRVL